MAIYFDNAATTQLDPRVLESMLPYFSEHFGNPSSIHSMGRKTRTAIEGARKFVANTLNASTAEIFFTSGGTESNNLVLTTATRDMGVTRIISSKIEHHCVMHTIEHLCHCHEVQIDFVSLDEKGRIDPAEVEKMLKSSSEKTLVSLMHANNEIGNITDLQSISAICKENGALLHSDTVQTFAHYPIDVQELQLDFLTGSAHKFHGPKGIGILYCNGDNPAKPLLHGGAQERNMRAGTENLYGIVGLEAALRIAIEEMDKDREFIQGLKDYAAEQLLANIPGLTFNGDYQGNSLYTVLNVAFPGDNPYLLFNLDIAGICASGGSACSSGSDAGSHVLRALHRGSSPTSVRFSFSRFNKREEVDILVAKLQEMVLVK